MIPSRVIVACVALAAASAAAAPSAPDPADRTVQDAAARYFDGPVAEVTSFEAQLVDLAARERELVQRAATGQISPNLANRLQGQLAYERGLAHSRLGQREEALAAFQQASEAEPSSAGRHCDVAVELGSAGRAADADAEFRRGIALDSSNGFCRGSFAFHLLVTGRAPEAAAQLKALTDQAPVLDMMNTLTLMLVNAELDRPLLQGTGREDRPMDPTEWADAMALHLLGKKSAQGLATMIGQDPGEAQGRACEALFYLGMFHAAHEEQATARRLLEGTLRVNMVSFREHTGAGLMLRGRR